MTGIDRIGAPPRAAAAARAAGGVAGSGRAGPAFPAPTMEAEADAPPSALAASAPVALDVLLALQQVDEPGDRDRTARRHGQALLAALARLQRALLEDAGMGAALVQLRTLAEAVPPAADPGLTAALEHVVLRARIELLRRAG